jgi:hypothetical protein
VLPSICHLAPVISAGKDLVLAGAAIATVWIAARGLRTWRAELRGKTDFEAARGLVHATFKLHDEISSSRSPLARLSIELEDDILNPDAAWSKAEIKAWAGLIHNRRESLQAALREFDGAVLEAEALWGKSIRDRTDRLRKCVLVLWIAFDSFLDDKRAGVTSRKGPLRTLRAAGRYQAVHYRSRR